MNPQLLSFLLGALLLLVAILGGGFELKEVKIPRVGTLARASAFVAGVFFLFVGMVGHQVFFEQGESPPSKPPKDGQPSDPDAAPSKANAEQTDQEGPAAQRGGAVSSGTSADLDKHRAPYRYSLAPGKSSGDIVGMGIAGSNDHVYILYRD